MRLNSGYERSAASRNDPRVVQMQHFVEHDVFEREAGRTRVVEDAYPGFNTLSQQTFWDAATRKVILDRVHKVPPIRFFTRLRLTWLRQSAIGFCRIAMRRTRFPFCHGSMSDCTKIGMRAIALRICRRTGKPIAWV